MTLIATIATKKGSYDIDNKSNSSNDNHDNKYKKNADNNRKNNNNNNNGYNTVTELAMKTEAISNWKH